ncbi:MAG TPA: TlpA disulfide reductase family protein [Bacteroidales bacterium]
MKKLTIYWMSLFLLIGITAVAQDGFVLTGYVKGYEGKTKLIINKILPTHDVDMVNEEIIYMMDGKFKWVGKVDGPTQYSIRIRPDNIPESNPIRGEDMSVFVENKTMVLTGEKGSFKYSHVTGGSPIQDQLEEWQNFIKSKIGNDDIHSSKNWELEHKYNLEFISLHPDYFISVYNFSWYIKWIPEMVPKTKAVEFYNKLDDSLQTSIYGQQIKYYIDNIMLSQKLDTQDKPHDFSLPDSSGNYISLKSLEGKVVLIDFWFSGCGACRIENRNYQAIYQRFHNKGFEILSVSRDKYKNNWIKALRADHITWKSVWDADSRVTTNMYLVAAFPTTYLVNSKGIIIAKNLRGEALESKLEEIFGGQ